MPSRDSCEAATAVLNYYGLQGWELVAAVPTFSLMLGFGDTEMEFYFKYPSATGFMGRSEDAESSGAG